jgi:hypothetical protein
MHSKVIATSVETPPPPDNKILYDDKHFTVFEEKMEPGETSSRHSFIRTTCRIAIYCTNLMSHLCYEYAANAQNFRLMHSRPRLHAQPDRIPNVCVLHLHKYPIWVLIAGLRENLHELLHSGTVRCMLTLG